MSSGIVIKYLILFVAAIVLGVTFVPKGTLERFKKALPFVGIIFVVFVGMDVSYAKFGFVGVVVMFVVLLTVLVTLLKIKKGKDNENDKSKRFR